MSAKVNALKAKHDEMLADLTAYLDAEDADLKVAEEKQAEYDAVKAELETATVLTAKVAQNAAEAKSRTEPAKPFLFNFGAGGKKGDGDAPKTLGQYLIQSESFKTWSPDQKRPCVVEVPGAFAAKTTLVSSPLTGYDRTPGVDTLGVQRPVVADLLAQGVTDQPTIRVLTENTFTNAASPYAENIGFTDAAWDLVENDFPVRKIGDIAHVTEEMLRDHPAVQSYVDNRLLYSVAIKEEDQILNGSGSSPNLTGILNTTGVQTYTLSSETDASAIFKGITKVRAVGFVEPTGMVVHPNDWQQLKLEKDANNQFYGGGPFTLPYGNGQYYNVPTYWGLPVIVTTSIAAGTVLVGDFRNSAQIFRRAGITMEMTNSDGTDFQAGRVAIRCYSRAALVIYRPRSFCKVLSIA